MKTDKRREKLKKVAFKGKETAKEERAERELMKKSAKKKTMKSKY